MILLIAIVGPTLAYIAFAIWALTGPQPEQRRGFDVLPPRMDDAPKLGKQCPIRPATLLLTRRLSRLARCQHGSG